MYGSWVFDENRFYFLFVVLFLSSSPSYPDCFKSKHQIARQNVSEVLEYKRKTSIVSLFFDVNFWANSMQMTLFQQHGLASWNIFFRISYAQNPCEIHSFPLSPLEDVKVGGCTGPHPLPTKNNESSWWWLLMSAGGNSNVYSDWCKTKVQNILYSAPLWKNFCKFVSQIALMNI